MKIRKTHAENINIIMNIYDDAKLFMTETGNGNQWINGYPSRELIMDDISKGNSYVCIDDNDETVGTFCFIRGDDPTYSVIYDGKWLNDDPYGVIHRLAGRRNSRGIAAACLQWCFEQCGNIRVDTHRDNIVMQNILMKNGFIRCGTVIIANGTERIAFQRTVNREQ
jgi:RimJ/RimL family protein N-acetyltransferase